MTKPITRDPIYRRRVFDAEVIELCVRWYITEFRASKIESGLQSVSTQTEGFLFSEASDADAKIDEDNRIATTAAKDAADLGVTVGNLHDFVIANKKELSDQFTAIRKYADGKRSMNHVLPG